MTEESESDRVSLLQNMFRAPGRGVQLSYLTVAYVFGEMSHYLVGVTSRDMAREIEYGDLACYDNDSFAGEANSSIVCEDIMDSVGCVSSILHLFLCKKSCEKPTYQLSMAVGRSFTQLHKGCMHSMFTFVHHIMYRLFWHENLTT